MLIKITLLMILVISIFAPHVAHAEKLKPIQFEEALRTDVPVSGNILAGMTLAGEFSQNNKIKIFAYVAATEQRLCVTVKSVDGRYYSTSRYMAAPKSEQWLELIFPSKYSEVIKSYNSEEISISVSSHQANSVCTSSGRLLLASWSNPENSHGSQVNIFINSGRVLSYLRQSGKGVKPVKCNVINSSRLVTYDKVCTIDISDLNQDKWTIIRRRMGKNMPPHNFNIMPIHNSK